MPANTAQEAFEKEKEKILKDLPENIKAMFGVMGFCKAELDEDDETYGQEGDVYIPCLVMNPYNVPPRPVRDVYWHGLYTKCKRAKKLGELDYLVYHYGSDDPQDCYSFIPQEEFMSYDSGIKSGFDKLPVLIQTKVDSGEALTEEEEQRVRGIEEMKEDALKPAEDRRRGNWQFKERYEEEMEGKEPAAKRQKKA